MLSMILQRTTHSSHESAELMHEVWEQIHADPRRTNKPVVCLFYGNLGAGKTACVKALAHELGIDDIVSPAFVVYYEYVLKNRPYQAMYHFDLYRIADAHEFDYLGMKDILVPGHFVAIEWSEKSGPVSELLSRAFVVTIRIEHGTHDNRHFTVEFP